jgi:TRAP-type C4-dicarboxylate transport system permease small subunit
MISIIKRLWQIFIEVEKNILIFGLLIMTICAFLQVILRYVFGISIMGLEAIARYLMIMIVFIGMGLAVQDNGHIKIDIINFLLKSTILRIALGILVNIIILIFALYYCWLSFEYLAYTYGSNQVDQMLNLPMYIPVSSLFIGFLFLVIHSLVSLFKMLLDLTSTK